ncbi:MAG: cation:proton antiporter, partial [Proteobacteria bacterium]|nr:cation:proton antiporter [Pseudomonadota bacterium]
EFSLPLLVALVAARLTGELLLRAGQPALVGEMFAGLALATIGLAAGSGWLLSLGDSPVIATFADVGAFFLVLVVGVEMRPSEIGRASRAGVAVALGGVLVPMAAGFTLVWWLLPGSDARFALAFLTGVALSISAVPATARIFGEMGLLHHAVGRTVIAAALIDDIIGLISLAVLTAIVQTGAMPNAAAFAIVVGKSAAFFAIAIAFSTVAYPFAARLLGSAHSRAAGLSTLLAAGMGFAVLAEAMGMHFILGPFVAGLFFEPHRVGKAQYDEQKLVLERIVAGFMRPIFFVAIGLNVDITVVAALPGFVAAIILTAAFGKLLGCGIPAWLAGMRPREALAVGIGMNSRGAIELIIAAIALRAGLIGESGGGGDIGRYLFSALALMALVTTLITPGLLRLVLRVRPVDSD